VVADEKISGMAELSFMRRNGEAVVTGLLTTAIFGFGAFLYGKYPTLLNPFACCLVCGASAFVSCLAVIALRRIPKPLPCPNTNNIHDYVRTWLDSRGLTVTSDPSNPTYFRYRVTLPPPDNEDLTIFRMRDDSSDYLQVYTDLGLKGEIGAQILSRFTNKEISRVIHEMKLELARSKIGYSGLVIPPTDFKIFRRVLIHPGLKETDFFSAIDDVEAAIHTVTLLYQHAIQQNQKTEPVSTRPELASDTPIPELPEASS
jgi:hypothetical protein